MMDKVKPKFNWSKEQDYQAFIEYLYGSDLSEIDEDEDLGDIDQAEAKVRLPDDSGLSSEDEDEAKEEIEVEVNDDLKLTPLKDIQWLSESVKYEFNKLVNNFEPPDLISELSDLVPINYFKKYLPDSIYSLLCEKTNMYILQNNLAVKNVSLEEIKICVGLYIAMGSAKYPRVRMYWDSFFGNKLFIESMGRDRFFQIRNCLHLVDNISIPKDNKDRFYKVRPLYNSIQSRCLELPKGENLSVDEQMIPFTGRLNIKQYIKNKPNPWGVKAFLLCGSNGLVHDFILYQGKKRVPAKKSTNRCECTQ